MARTSSYGSATERLARIVIATLALVVAQAMVRHLIAGLHDEYFWPILAYLTTSLPAFAAMALPGPLDERRRLWCLPFLAMTVFGLVHAFWPRA